MSDDTVLFLHFHLNERNKPVNDGFQVGRKTVTVQWKTDDDEIRLNDFPEDRILIVIDDALPVSLCPAAETAVTGCDFLFYDIYDFDLMHIPVIQSIQKGCSEAHRIAYLFGTSVQYQYFQCQILLSYSP